MLNSLSIFRSWLRAITAYLVDGKRELSRLSKIELFSK
jgi:hypothetical protein